MKQAVEVVHLVGGSPVTATTLSLRRERAAAIRAFLVVWVGYAAMVVAASLVGQRFGRVMYLPGVTATWLLLATGVSLVAARRARRRAQRFALGTRLDADAFCDTPVDLVRRGPAGFEIGLTEGMTGEIEAGRAPLPVEAFINEGTRTFALDDGASARLSLGTSTFVIRCRAEDNATEGRWTYSWREALRPSSRLIFLGLQLTAVASLICMFPRGVVLDGKVRRATGFQATTPWEAEKWLRVEAQSQALSLHQCFDSLPLACQRPGFVGVGVALNREGEVRANWIATSTYGADCPVEICMSHIVSTWSFDPLPESMRVVLPVQVLRTNKPLPAPPAKTASTAKAEAPASLAALEWPSDGI